MDTTADYAVSHFAAEEGCMRQYDYPGYIGHKKLHDDFTAEVVKFVQAYESGGTTTEMVVSVITDLGSWTRDHIRAKDQKLGEFLVSAQKGG